jgi:hypothetical protein
VSYVTPTAGQVAHRHGLAGHAPRQPADEGERGGAGVFGDRPVAEDAGDVTDETRAFLLGRHRLCSMKHPGVKVKNAVGVKSHVLSHRSPPPRRAEGG